MSEFDTPSRDRAAAQEQVRALGSLQGASIGSSLAVRMGFSRSMLSSLRFDAEPPR
jgi:hypothetical protein